MFQLTKEEAENLRLQIGTSNESRGGRRYLPYAFTEHGVAMLSALLKSERAVQMSILIVRASVQYDTDILQDITRHPKSAAPMLRFTSTWAD